MVDEFIDRLVQSLLFTILEPQSALNIYVLAASTLFLAAVRKKKSLYLRRRDPENLATLGLRNDEATIDFFFMLFYASGLFTGTLFGLNYMEATTQFIKNNLELNLPAIKEQGGTFFLTLILLILYRDFLTYWYHRLFHKSALLFRLHSVHHSIETMNLFGSFRAHPLEVFLMNSIGWALYLLSSIALLSLIGLQGLAMTKAPYLLGLLVGLFKVNNIFRHSNLIIFYPKWLSHILISPAMHLVHHSANPVHAGRNYGALLAIWDQFFRTLYIPSKDEFSNIRYGFGDGLRLAHRSKGKLTYLLFELPTRIYKKK